MITQTVMIRQTVQNPNFIDDLAKYLSLGISKDRLIAVLENISKSQITLREKLETLVDRIEFIEHLKLVKEVAQKNRYLLNNREVVGIDWDIDALRLYLALTCIDILSLILSNLTSGLSLTVLILLIQQT